jgi:acyl-coenzyme A thioesterase PaaI-like protein
MSGVDPGLRRLSDEIRRLIELTVTVDADAAEVEAATEAVRGAADRLEPFRGGDPSTRYGLGAVDDPHDVFPASPVIGYLNPMALPVELEIRDGVVHGRAHFGSAYEGPPGCVHGAVIASSFDELLGVANIANQTPGMTAHLGIRYRKPTPLHADLRLEGRCDRVEGRKIFASGRIHRVDTDEVTAECEGLFIDVGGKFESYRRERGIG